MIPVTTHFMAELAFWLLAGYFLCARLMPVGFDGSYPRWRFDVASSASLHAIWVILATGRIELALAELLCYSLTVSETADLSWSRRHFVHLARQVLWFVAVIWFWPRV